MSSSSSSEPRTLDEWLGHLEALHPRGEAGIELGLERVRRVKEALGQCEHCPVIIVGGTNGKGSTVAYLERILCNAGYKVGAYTSPHLLRYNERVRVAGVPVADETLIAAFARVEAGRGNEALTYFEFGTLTAWEVFAVAECDAVVLEVGLGGRLDAVNVYEPDVAIVTGVALDHTDWLGPTREHIGFEKAGIFRTDRPAFCADPEPPRSLVEHAEKIGADLRLLGRDFGYFGDKTQWMFWTRAGLRRGGLAPPALRGRQQLGNAAVVLAALDALKEKLPVDMAAIRRGLIETELPGRFQVLPGRPAVVLDVAHNPQAVATLAGNLDEMGFFEHTWAVAGMLADKDRATALACLRGRIDGWFFTDLPGPRGAGAESLRDALLAKGDGAEPLSSIELHSTPETAFTAALKRAGESDRILVFGSFLTVAAILRFLEAKERRR